MGNTSTIDPKLAGAVVLILDRVMPALDDALVRSGQVSAADDPEADAGTHWFNGALFGCLAAYMHLNAQRSVSRDEIGALMAVAAEIIEDAVDRYGHPDLDRYAREVLGLLEGGTEEAAHA